jgi:hypothetical protein
MSGNGQIADLNAWPMDTTSEAASYHIRPTTVGRGPNHVASYLFPDN